VVLFLTACGSEEPYVPVFQAEASVAPMQVASAPETLAFDLQIEVSGHMLARHEPVNGAFIGAYIARDASIGGIEAFEAEIGVEHAIFAHTMTLGEEYPIRWVLENLAMGKTPFITLMPPEDYARLDMHTLADPLREFAAEAGRFNVPVFVELFPLTSTHNYGPAEYIAFFAAARNIFNFHAPNVALVWGFDAQNLPVSAQFYPGRDAVDWINLKVYNHVDADGGFRDFFTYVDFFYFAYQQERPLMLSLAVSHYLAADNRYFTAQAAEKIEYIYGRLGEYPRIKAVIYRSYNDITGGGKFSLHEAQVISAAYAQAVSDGHFLHFVGDFHAPREAVQMMRSPFRAVMRDGYFYIPRRALVYDARFSAEYLTRLDGLETEIDGDIFFSMSNLNTAVGMDFFVDMVLLRLTLRR